LPWNYLDLFFCKRERSRPKCVGPQEINLFAQVALNPYGSSSACRLTGYSFRDLIWNPNLGVGFSLRCFQRLSQRNVATRHYSWRYNRHTRDSSREVLSYCPQLSSRFRRFHRIESDIIVLNYPKALCLLGKPTIACRIRPYLNHLTLSSLVASDVWPVRIKRCKAT